MALETALLLGDEPRVVINVARSLSRAGIQVIVGKLSTGVCAIPSRAVSRYAHLPYQTTNLGLAVEQLVAFVHHHHFDIVVPCSDSALQLVRAGHADLDALALLCCPDADAIGRVLDKSATLALAGQCGIACPEHYAIGSIDELDASSAEIRFPVIAKPRSKEQASHFKLLTIPDLPHLRELILQDAQFGRNNLIQEFVPGHGVGVGLLFDGTDILVGFQHRRLREYPVEGGVSVQAVAEPVAAVLEAAAVRLLRAVSWQGVAMVEFRWDPARQRAVLMEINGRYWGSLALALKTGIDFPRYEVEWRHDSVRPTIGTYSAGKTMIWVSGVLLRTKQIARQEVPPGTPAPSVLAELQVLVGVLAHPSRDALWSGADPVPSALEALITTAHVIRALLGTLARRVMPRSVVAMIRVLRRVRPNARRTYVALRLRHWLGMPVRIGSRRWHGARVLVLLCHGNIMRSAFAAARLRQLLADSEHIDVRSAGVWAQPGRPAEGPAQHVAAQLGVPLEDHRATRLTPELVHDADAILVMDFLNLADVLSQFPEARGKTQLLAAISGPAHEITDPYGSDFAAVARSFSLIDRAVSVLANRLRGSRY